MLMKIYNRQVLDLLEYIQNRAKKNGTGMRSDNQFLKIKVANQVKLARQLYMRISAGIFKILVRIACVPVFTYDYNLLQSPTFIIIFICHSRSGGAELYIYLLNVLLYTGTSQNITLFLRADFSKLLRFTKQQTFKNLQIPDQYRLKCRPVFLTKYRYNAHVYPLTTQLLAILGLNWVQMTGCFESGNIGVREPIFRFRKSQ
ncbi:Hypothetical_protein [Hexamita inflata]|uniref:Hypothetical_protein n=1 Tax=Hexamita inflata TaxID=28002 RepID=A0ABP1HSN2_9EUKA